MKQFFFRLKICVILLILAGVALAADPMLAPGRNGLPSSLSAFPEFIYAKRATGVTLWLFYKEGTAIKADPYIQVLEKAGYTFNGDSYVNGEKTVYIGLDLMTFSVGQIMKPYEAADVLLKSFPEFEIAQFGALSGMSFDLFYEKPVAADVINRYNEQMKKAGFELQELERNNVLYYFKKRDSDQLSWNFVYY